MDDKNIQLTLEEINSIITSLKCSEKNSTNISCPICSKTSSNSDITTHLLLKHTVQEYYNCNWCTAKFEERLYLELHKINHLNENQQFQCTYCNTKFGEEILRKIHEIKTHKEQNYLHRCNICNRKFFKTDPFFKHLLVHVEQLNPEYSKYFCYICEEYYFTLERLKNHFSNVHSDTFDSTVDGNSLEKQYQNLSYNNYPGVGFGFIEGKTEDVNVNIESEILINTKSQSNGIEHENEIDDENMEIQSTLIEEILVSHYRSDENDENSEEYIIEEVEDKIISHPSEDKIISHPIEEKAAIQTITILDSEKTILFEEYLEDTDNEYEVHSPNADAATKLADNHVDSNFDSDDDLPVFEFFEDMKDVNESALKISTNSFEIEKLKLINKSRSKGGGCKFPCPVCAKLFRTRSIVNEHLNTHTGLRPHKCAICLQKFSFKAALKRHTKAHNNEKNYKCSFCKEGFITNFERTRHEKIWHADSNKIKSYKEKKYLNPKALKSTEDGLYYCAFCNKKYQRAQSLRQHLKIHTNTKECAICNKPFGFLSSLKRHMANVHSIRFRSKTEKLIEIEISKT